MLLPRAARSPPVLTDSAAEVADQRLTTWAGGEYNPFDQVVLETIVNSISLDARLESERAQRLRESRGLGGTHARTLGASTVVHVLHVFVGRGLSVAAVCRADVCVSLERD